jgi:hypothetical protein
LLVELIIELLTGSNGIVVASLVVSFLGLKLSETAFDFVAVVVVSMRVYSIFSLSMDSFSMLSLSTDFIIKSFGLGDFLTILTSL